MASLADSCRLCLGPHDSINVLSYLDGKTKLSAVLQQVTGIQYPDGVQLPRNVCESCFDKARDVYHFQQACYKALQQLLQTTPTHSVPLTVQQPTQPSTVQTPSSSTHAIKTSPAKQPETECIYVIQEMVPSVAPATYYPPQDVQEDVMDLQLDGEDEEDVAAEEEEDDDDGEEEDVEEESDFEDKVDPPDYISAEEDDHPEDSKKHLSDLQEFLQIDDTKAKPRVQREKRNQPTITSTVKEAPAVVTTTSPSVRHNFGCGQCGKYFLTHKKLADHTARHHEQKPVRGDAKIYMCTKCIKKFESPEDLRNHERECDDSETLAKPFACKVCPQRFAFKRQLQEHSVAEHEGQKRYSCGQCPMKFTRSSQVTMHMRVHTNEKPFQCEVCQASFAKKTNMMRHMKTHGTDTSFACSVCGKQFKWETSLKVHMNTHTKTRMYKCEHCEKDYGSMSGYRKHMAAAHKDIK